MADLETPAAVPAPPVSGTTGQMLWRLVDTGFGTAAENMAVDEAILLAHSR